VLAEEGVKMTVSVLYARRSKPSQTDTRDTVDSQLEELRAFAKARGWNETVEMSERGTPASAAADRNMRRKVFHGELLPMVDRGDVERVLVVEPSRISRHMATFIPFVDRVEVWFTRDNRSSRDTDPLRLALDAGLAAQESKIRSDRQKAHRARMRENGRKSSGGFRRYGYEPDGLTLRPKEVRLIRRSAEDVLRGRPLRQVAFDWRGAGVLNARGKPVASGSIRSALLKTDLLDEETRERLRAYLADPKRRGNKGGFNKRTFLLSGFVFCAECGTGLTSDRAYNGTRSYKCKVSASDGKLDACGLVSGDAEMLEEQVRREVARATIWKRAGQGGARLAAERARLTAQRDEVADAFADGTLTREQVRRANARLDEREQKLNEQIREVPPAGLEKVQRYAPDDFPRWRALVEKRVERVDVSKSGKGKVTFKQYVRPGVPERRMLRVRPPKKR
jgi:DNA invertase Pin-like site-specific DNA recombinase